MIASDMLCTAFGFNLCPLRLLLTPSPPFFYFLSPLTPTPIYRDVEAIFTERRAGLAANKNVTPSERVAGSRNLRKLIGHRKPTVTSAYNVGSNFGQNEKVPYRNFTWASRQPPAVRRFYGFA